MEVHPRITVEPDKCGGKPCIRGHRLTVEHILALLAEGTPQDDVLREWDFLEPEDVQTAMKFASCLAGEYSSAGADRAGISRSAESNVTRT